MTHPLLDLFLDAADGRFPPTDGAVSFLPPLEHGISAVVSFTAHAVVASALGIDQLDGIGIDGYGGAMAPEALLRLAQGGRIGVIDVILSALGLGGGDLVETDQWDHHARVSFARAHRTDVTVYGDSTGFVTLASGLAGRCEMSVETVASLHGTGTGRSLIRSARRMVPKGEWVFAAVSPGNARSLRAFLSQGFVPIGSEVHLTPPGAEGPGEHHGP